MDWYTPLVSHVLFPLHERLKGHDTVRHRRALEKSQWWGPEQLEALQRERLQALVAEAFDHVPGYRALLPRHFSATEIRSLADLGRLPLTDKGTIRAAGPAWRDPQARLVAQSTSGSSGEPLHFFLGKDRIAMDVAARWRATRWWGLDLGDREAVLWGSVIENSAQKNALRIWRDRLFRSQLIPASDLSVEDLDRMLDKIITGRPRMLFGYPSIIARLAWRARQRGMGPDDFSIRVAFVTAELLQEAWRQEIETTLGCQVASEYGARDAGLIARECPAGGWHIAAEGMVVEIVDDEGRPVPAGQEGEVTVTNLFSSGFPFIRYRVGDRAAVDPDPCACGRGLPRLREVAGRSNDALVAMDGRRVHYTVFMYLLREVEGLKAYRVEQFSPDRVTVFTVFEADSPPTALVEHLEETMAHHLGPGVNVTLQVVSDIPSDPNGKFRHVVCHVPEPEVATPHPRSQP